MEHLKKLWKTIDHNRFMSIMFLVAGFIMLYIVGCESQTTSLIDKNKKVTRQELVWEIESLLRSSETRFVELDKQDKLKELLLEQAILISEGGTFNPVALIPTILSILGIGAIADNRRKDRIIRENIVKYIDRVHADTS